MTGNTLARQILLALTLAAAGCGDKDDSAADGTSADGTSADGADGTSTDGTDGADGTGADGADGADGTSGTGVQVTEVTVSECDDSTGAPRLDASLAGSDSIRVSHDNFEGNCCAELTVTVSEGASNLAMVYTDTGEPCDCLCSFDLTYTLTEVPPGSYSVTAAGGVSDTVDIP